MLQLTMDLATSTLCGLLQLEGEVSRLETSVTRVQQELEGTRDKLLKTEKARHVISERGHFTVLPPCVVVLVHMSTITQQPHIA